MFSGSASVHSSGGRVDETMRPEEGSGDYLTERAEVPRFRGACSLGTNIFVTLLDSVIRKDLTGRLTLNFQLDRDSPLPCLNWLKLVYMNAGMKMARKKMRRCPLRAHGALEVAPTAPRPAHHMARPGPGFAASDR